MTTTTRIMDLGRAAAEAGDIEQAAICAVALGEDWAEYDLDVDERARVGSLTIEQAQDICEEEE